VKILIFLHEKGVIHRDIAARNFLLTAGIETEETQNKQKQSRIKKEKKQTK
jgi:serine/threonine protein kinase